MSNAQHLPFPLSQPCSEEMSRVRVHHHAKVLPLTLPDCPPIVWTHFLSPTILSRLFSIPHPQSSDLGFGSALLEGAVKGSTSTRVYQESLCAARRNK